MVGGHTSFAGRLGDDSDTLLYGPAQQNLGIGLVVSLSNRGDDIVLKERSSGDSLVNTEGDEGGRTEGAVSSDLNALFLDPLDQGALLKVGVEFN